MNKETLTIVVRAALQALAGGLAARGIAIENGSLELITGAVVAVITIVWSHKEKAKIKSGNTATIAKP